MAEVKRAQLITKSIGPLWANVRAVRASVHELLVDYPREFDHAVAMASSELLENAIKYGEEVPAAPMIKFSLEIVEDKIQIQVLNGSTDTVAVNELVSHVRLVNDSSDNGTLYLARLQELLIHPCANTKLGIYRVAHEGQFELDCTYINEVVTVTATRSLP